MKNSKENKVWGFLRETSQAAKKEGIDKDTGIGRTGLDEYLKVIFPNVHDWVHDKGGVVLNGNKLRYRPDYRSEKLKLIVEFDGLPHYTSPANIIKDEEKSALFRAAGYNVVRIPYFIQLTNDAIEKMFGVSLHQPMFDGTVPSLGPLGRNTPAFLCIDGIKRMAKEFLQYPDQYQTNVEALRRVDNPALTRVDVLEYFYDEFQK